MRWESFKENFKIAVHSIRGQALRASLTVLIIGIGLTALVGILTSTAAIDKTIQDNFALLGSNTFTIQAQGFMIRIGKRGMQQKSNPAITYAEAMRFKERSGSIPATISLSLGVSGTAELVAGRLVREILKEPDQWPSLAPMWLKSSSPVQIPLARCLGMEASLTR
jgi:putative ABC transport system permease protein